MMHIVVDDKVHMCLWSLVEMKMGMLLLWMSLCHGNAATDAEGR